MIVFKIGNKIKRVYGIIVSIVLITILVGFINNLVIYAASNFDPVPSGSTNVSSSKVINYIDGKKKSASGSVFCIGQDRIEYQTMFSDIEKDYKLTDTFTINNKISKTNNQLSNPVKQPKSGTFQVKYKHNNKYYDNAPEKSGLDGYWKDAKMEYDITKGSWIIGNLNGEDYVFNDPTDDKRGEWTIYVKAEDDTGYPDFDKETAQSGAYSTTFRVHKAPVPKFSFTENNTHATLSDAGSYDIDYQFSKNNRLNNVNNREYAGIKEFYWSAKIGDNWVDVGKGPSVTFSKQGKAVTDYRLTVEDYDGAFASISKTSLIMEDPDANFEFRVGNKVTTYVYKGNAGNETLTVNPLISWNDEAYSWPAYGTSGTQTQKWTAIPSMLNANTVSAFNFNVLKSRFTDIQNAGGIKVKLDAKNKYDLVDSATKSAHVHNIIGNDRTGTEEIVDCPVCNPVTAPKKPFLVGTNATMLLDVTNPNGNLDELVVELNIPGLGISREILESTSEKFKSIIPLKDVSSYNKALWDQFDYSFKIYSKRTGEHLNNNTGTAYIHTPINLSGLINGKRDEEIEINTDDVFKVSATTEKYAEVVTVTLPVNVIDQDTDKVIMAGNKINLKPNTAHTNWEKQLVVSSDDLEEDKKINAQFEAIAYNKRDRETDNIGISLISFRLENFRIVKVRDIRLEDYYKNPINNPIKYVNDMAIDSKSFYPYAIDSLTKGYIFEFEIDSINFEGNNDTVFIRPSFYSAVGTSTRATGQKEAYWIDSNKKVWEIGQGGHSKYNTITLNKSNRTNIAPNKSTWKGQYFIPGTSFLTNPGNTISTAKNNDLKSDIIVSFNIEGLQNGTPKFNYNLKQWSKERTESKFPYQIGDVIRYGSKNNLEDLKVHRKH